MESCIGRSCSPAAIPAPIGLQPEPGFKHESAPEHIEDGQVQLGSSGSSRDAISSPLPGTDCISLTIPQLRTDLPPRPEFTPFTVPYLCASSQYDAKGFWTYPERRGWIIHLKDTNCHVLCPPGFCCHGTSLVKDGVELSMREKPPIFTRADGIPVLASDKAMFLQAWLFFGLLTEVSALCGLDLDIPAEFVVDNGSISTAKLNGLPGRWFAAAVQTHRAGDTSLMERILALMRQAILVLDEERNETGTLMFNYTYAECRVLHSLDIACRTLALHLLFHIYMPGFTAPDEDGWGRQRISNSVDWIGRRGEGLDQLSSLSRDELEEKGWCESELDLLAAEDLAFASLLSRPMIRDHSRCGDIVCNAYQTDEATYMTRHVSDGCSCTFVGTETSALVDALSKDKVPKVVITEQLELQVIVEDDYPYIALSHVWADGLGNPFKNALPRCQLRRLRNFSKELYRESNPAPESAGFPVGLWMDTLCIPVEPSANEYRKKAIHLMGKTFNDANVVLVLDRELEIVESMTASFLELGLRILCSGWIKRLWTLQEAALASEAHGIDKLYFQMHDGPFLYQKYDRNRRALRHADKTEIRAEERTILLESAIMLELGAQIPSIHVMRDMREGWSQFRVIYYAIEHRSTSKAEDIPICITSLLGKDLSTILSTAEAESRMASFYVLMREIPLGVMWCERPEKVGPQTVSLGTHVYHLLPSKYRGFTLDIEEEDVETTLPDAFNIATETGEVLAKLIRHSQRARWDIPMQQNLALVLRQDDRSAVLFPRAAIVAVEGIVQHEELQATEFVCQIVGYMDILPPDGSHDKVFRGHLTGDNQMWCIT
ncbi:Het domain protein [Mycena sanguinolenta]|uniref:Het domain protein n=1 Tax=Mycena sanguinolenta TaxID=230812 RepID=A0A8H6Y2E1_9AGAR|nr:Het domain protein [Mycena sanguinolenta]